MPIHISIALCTFNGAQYLSDQLNSIAKQTRLPDELVIFDDCSQDSTKELLAAFSVTVPFNVRVYHNQQTIGSTRNFEQAIRACEGDIIALADQDDIWYSYKLDTIERALSNATDAGMVFSDADVVSSDLKPLGYTLWQSVRFSKNQQTQIAIGSALPTLLRHPVVTGATSAFRATYRHLILPISSLWIHDEWIALLIALRAPLTLVERPLMQYRHHSSNQIGTEDTHPIERLRTAFTTNPMVYLSRAEQFCAIKDHIQSVMPDCLHLSAFEEKIQHMKARGSLPKQHLLRIPPVLRELISQRYTQYSASSLNALRDILLKHA